MSADWQTDKLERAAGSAPCTIHRNSFATDRCHPNRLIDRMQFEYRTDSRVHKPTTARNGDRLSLRSHGAASMNRIAAVSQASYVPRVMAGLLILALTATGRAQDSTQFVTGIVRDKAGQPVAGAEVSLHQQKAT